MNGNGGEGGKKFSQLSQGENKATVGKGGN